MYLVHTKNGSPGSPDSANFFGFSAKFGFGVCSFGGCPSPLHPPHTTPRDVFCDWGFVHYLVSVGQTEASYVLKSSLLLWCPVTWWRRSKKNENNKTGNNICYQDCSRHNIQYYGIADSLIPQGKIIEHQYNFFLIFGGKNIFAKLSHPAPITI